MANHKSAVKRARQNEKRRIRNAAIRKSLRTSTKQFETAIQSGNKEEATELLKDTSRRWDMGVSKNVVHKNAAARKKSRLAKKLNDLMAGKVYKETKAKKKKKDGRKTAKSRKK